MHLPVLPLARLTDHLPVRECVQKPDVGACVHASVGGVTLAGAAGQAAVLHAALETALEASLNAVQEAVQEAVQQTLQAALQQAALGVVLKEPELKLAAPAAEMTSCYAVGAQL